MGRGASGSAGQNNSWPLPPPLNACGALTSIPPVGGAWLTQWCQRDFSWSRGGMSISGQPSAARLEKVRPELPSIGWGDVRCCFSSPRILDQFTFLLPPFRLLLWSSFALFWGFMIILNHMVIFSRETQVYTILSGPNFQLFLHLLSFLNYVWYWMFVFFLIGAI